MKGHCLFAVPVTPQDRLDQLVQHFQNPSSPSEANDLWLWILLVGAVAAAAWLMGRWIWGKFWKKDHPWGLFFSLCRRHRLTHRERWALWTLARTRTPEMPARVFLDPDLFRPEAFPSVLTSKADLLEELRFRLFGPIESSSEKKPAEKKPAESGFSLCSEAEIQEKRAELELPPVGFPTVRAPSLDLPPWTGACPPSEPLPPAAPVPPQKSGLDSLGLSPL